MPSSEAPGWRLFIALPLPGDAAAAVQHALLPYAAEFPEARWLAPAALHVTLRFLGATPPDAVAGIQSSVDRLAREMRPPAEPFEVATDRGAGRARSGDGVAWLTIGRGGDAIAAYAQRLGGLLSVMPALSDAVARPLPDPHVTVARHADQRLIDALTSMALGPLSVAWRADRIVLFRSHPSRGAAAYESLHEARLRAAA
jgi:2'-5' RNA ligase